MRCFLVYCKNVISDNSVVLIVDAENEQVAKRKAFVDHLRNDKHRYKNVYLTGKILEAHYAD